MSPGRVVVMNVGADNVQFNVGFERNVQAKRSAGSWCIELVKFPSTKPFINNSKRSKTTQKETIAKLLKQNQ